MELKPIVSFLNLKKILRRDVVNFDQLRDEIRQGFPFGAFVSASENLNVEERSLFDLISTSPRTASRRLADRARLRESESDNLVRVARVTYEASQVLGSLGKASQWLQTPIRALGGKTPFSMLDSDLGAAQVDEILTRIDEGIIS